MTRGPAGRRLHLTVVNPEALEFGCRPSHTFGVAGGTIGGREAAWHLSDRGGRIAQLHAQIVGIDGTFCLVDRSGLTRINGAPEALDIDRIVRLADGDTVQVGPYRLNVHIGHEAGDTAAPFEDRSLDEILATPDPLDGDNAWQEEQSGYRILTTVSASDDEQVDPLLALDAAAARNRGDDPFDPTHYGLSARQESPPDRADTMVEAFRDRHFLAVPSRQAVAEPPRDEAGGSGAVRAPFLRDTYAAVSLIGTVDARDALRDALRERTATLSRYEDALLHAVDEALRELLARADGGSGLDGAQQGGLAHQKTIAEFWRGCELAYRRRMGRDDA